MASYHLCNALLFLHLIFIVAVDPDVYFSILLFYGYSWKGGRDGIFFISCYFKVIAISFRLENSY